MSGLKKTVAFFVVALVLAAVSQRPPAAAAEEFGGVHPIDAEFERKLDADSSTAGIIDACLWAEKEWDKLLNENYKILMKKLDKESGEKLRKAQREWIKFRDSEFEFIRDFYRGFDGSMYRTVAAGFQTDFVRERALSLGLRIGDLADK
ncbi:MAG: lysozyme inhibitor LprI family protein [Aminivibrio sp.]